MRRADRDAGVVQVFFWLVPEVGGSGIEPLKLGIEHKVKSVGVTFN